MSVLDLFSKRQKKLRGEVPDIYTYDSIPDGLRIQILYIIKDAIGLPSFRSGDYSSQEMYKVIHDTLCREYGVLNLANNGRNEYERLSNFFLLSTDNDRVIDVIELSFRCISTYIHENYWRYRELNSTKQNSEEAVTELNERFKEHGIGYQFERNQVIKVDSTYSHSEITKPTIALLWNKKFLGANDEYMSAHEHYRHGRNKECLNDCLKAFESVMKTICTEKGWAYNENDTAKKLIQVCFDNGLLPVFTQNQFSSLQSILTSGIPTIRNRQGGHGQGQDIQIVDDRMARYALNITGTNIIFLVDQSGIK